MNNIFVNYNNSLALKEKGYNEPFFFYYRTDDEVKEVHHAMHTTALVYNQKTIDDEVVAAPIQQDIIIWLRKNHNILLWYQPWEGHLKEGKWPLWNYYIKVPGKKVISSDGYGYFTTPEIAINSALERILRELI